MMKNLPYLITLLVLGSCAQPGGGTTDPVPRVSPVDLSTAEGLHDVSENALYTLANGPGWERKNTTFYHVWVSAFADGGDADAYGDLTGLKGKIDGDYFTGPTGLGINALWLSPIFDAGTLTAGSGNKHGYDTKDYNTVSALYGGNAAIQALLTSAHSKGIRVIFDFVPNHTSNAHPWFADPLKKSWYVYKDVKPTGWGGFDASNDWYGTGTNNYYGVFGGGMPDLNYWNKTVQNTMANVVMDWLNSGFDGVRIDAVKYLYEGATPSTYKDQLDTFEYFQALRTKVIDAFTNSNKFMVAENWEGNMSNVKDYLEKGGKKGFNQTFDFIWPYKIRDNLSGSGTSTEVNNILGHMVTTTNSLPAGSSFGVFQSNHDNVVSRPAYSYLGDGKKMSLAAALSILGKGTPYIYYGNEIGMVGKAGDDIKLRQNFDWTIQGTMASDSNSLWTWHKQLLQLRRDYGAFDDPSISALTTNLTGTLAYKITGITGKEVVVVASLRSTPGDFMVSGISGSPTVKVIIGSASHTTGAGTINLTGVPAYGVRVYALNDGAATVFRSTDVNGSVFVPVLPPVVGYLKGTFTAPQWNESVVLTESPTRIFKATMTGAGVAIEFKFADFSWSVSYGMNDLEYNSSAPSAMASNLFTSTAGNITFTAAASKTYDAYLDLTTVQPRFWVVQTN